MALLDSSIDCYGKNTSELCLTKWKEEEISFQPSVTQACSPAGAGAGDMTE